MPLVRVSGGDAADTFDVADMAERPSFASPSSHAKNPLSPTPPETSDDWTVDSSSHTDRGRHSTVSVGSLSSHLTSGEPAHGGAHVPLYDASENIDELQHDPRNPFHRKSCDDYIPEEDEASQSTLDSSVAPSLNHQPGYLHPQPRNLQRRPRSSQSSRPDADDVSIASNQSHRSNLRRRKSDDNSLLIKQLETKVANLSLEVATSKGRMDELYLENRQLTEERDKLSTNYTLLREENERLHMKIDRLEKENEQLQMKNAMEGTKGVVSSVDGSGTSKSVDGGSDYVPVRKQTLGKADGGLEVPFRSQESNYHLRPRRRSSQASTDSCNSTEGGSRGEFEAQSLSLNESNRSCPKLSLPFPNTDEPEAADEAPKRRMGLLNVMGAGKTPSVLEATKRMGEAFVSNALPQSRPPQRQGALTEGSAEDDAGVSSNPQGETFNDDDPFATWSVPGDPKRREKEPNWLQRGLGGGKGRDGGHPQDPFDTARKDDSGLDESESYTSFPIRESSDGEDGEDPREKKLGLFKGFGKKR